MLLQTVAATVLVLATGGAGSAARRLKLHRDSQRARADAAVQQVSELAGQLRATERALHQMATTVPQLDEAPSEEGLLRAFAGQVPAELAGTELARQMTVVMRVVTHTVQRRTYAEQTRADMRIALAQRAARQAAEQAQRAADQSMQAAVQDFAASVVAEATTVSQRVRVGGRRHEGDEAYVTMLGIDQPVRQMLLAAQGGARDTRSWGPSPTCEGAGR